MLDYGNAHTLAAILLGFAFVTVLSMYVINHRDRVRA
jgi:hypothetical protein